MNLMMFRWLLSPAAGENFSLVLAVLLVCNVEAVYAQESRSNESLFDTFLLNAELEIVVEEGEGVVESGEVDDREIFRHLITEQQENIIDRAFPLLAAKWLFNNIFVCWETLDDKHIEARATVKEAVAESWAAVSSLEFLGWGLCSDQSQGIRIAVRDEGPHVQFLGKFVNKVKDGMVLNFDYKNWGQGCQEKQEYCNTVIAVHEFGHAIGFAHEQNRPDTPGDCDKQQGSDGDSIELTPWDPDSVMNYCNPIYGNNGNLSDFDILAVRHIYGED